MKKLSLKVGLLALPYLVISVAAAFLPLNFFTFRVWEALATHKRSPLLAGAFYPNQKMAMVEVGDLGHGTRYAVPKKVSWETDRYGYRKAPSASAADIVIVGDSNVVGSSLSQEDTLSEVLERKVGRVVYPFAPERDINTFIRDPRFTLHPPKVVVYEQVEREMFGCFPLREPAAGKEKRRIDNPVLTKAAIMVDRISKLEPFKWAQAKITPKAMGVRYRDQFFLLGDAVVSKAEAREIENTVRTVVKYNDYFKKRNIRFIYMGIPNKETIYYDYLPSGRRSMVLRQVLAGLKESGVETVDLVKAYDTVRQGGAAPYQTDDTHWSPFGVEVAARLVEERLKGSF